MNGYRDYAIIRRKLDELRVRARAVRAAEGAMLFISLLIGAATFLILIEGWISLPAGLRWGAAVLLALGASAGFFMLVIRKILAFRAEEEVALLAEGRFPELDNALINAVRLAADRENPSPALVEAVISESAMRAAGLDLKKAVPVKELRRNACAGAAVIVAASILFALFPGRMKSALARVVMPGKDIPRVGGVVIKEVSPGDVTLVAGDPLNIAAIIEPAGVDTPAFLHYEFDGGRPATVRMPGDLDDQGRLFRCRASLADIRVPLRYRVEIGGSESRTFRVEVVEKPSIVSVARRYEYPRHMGIEPAEQEDSEGLIDVPAGTLVHLRATASKPVASAAFRRDGDEEIPMLIEADRKQLTLGAPFRLTQNGTYAIRVADAHGNENSGDPRYLMRARPDRSPDVTIAAPGRDSELEPGASLDIVIRGMDDYGITRARLAARRDTAEDDILLREWAALEGRSHTLHWTWKLDPATYPPGTTIRYRAEMWDNNDMTGPGKGVSPEYAVRIVEPGARAEERAERIGDWRMELQRLLDEQRRLREQAGGLAPDGEALK